MADDIYQNPLSDPHHHVSRTSFQAAKESVRNALSNESSTSSAKSTHSSSHSVVSNNSNNSNNISDYNNHTEVNNNAINDNDENELYGKLKSKAVQAKGGSVEYVYSLVDKEDKRRNKKGTATSSARSDMDNKDSNSADAFEDPYSHINTPHDKNHNDNSNHTDNHTDNHMGNHTDNHTEKFQSGNSHDIYDHIGDEKDEAKEKEASSTEDFYAVFLGSTLVDLKQLKNDKVVYVTSCIRSVAGLTSAATTLSKTKSKSSSSSNSNKVTLSENRGMSVVIRMEESGLKVCERSTNKIRLLIGLNHIRMWGVGSEKKSRELAIISKDDAVQNVLCRVFLCEEEASVIAKSFYDVCQKLAAKRNKKKETSPATNGTTRSNESKSSSRLNLFKKDKKKDKDGDSDSKKSITQSTLPLHSSKTLPHATNTVKTSCSADDNSSFSSLESNRVACDYLGMMEVKKSTGTKTLEHAIDMVKKFVREESWLHGELKCSPRGVYFINNSTIKLTCASADITFASTSIKHKNFLGLIVSRLDKWYVHVFSIDGDCVGWFETMKFVCHLHSSKYPKTDSTFKKWK